MSWQHGTDEAVTLHLQDVMKALLEGTFVGVILEDKGNPRANFLASVKLYHPNRVARRSGDIRKLANEVFIAIKVNVPTAREKSPTLNPKVQSTIEESQKNSKVSTQERMRQARAKARRSRASSGLQKQFSSQAAAGNTGKDKIAPNATPTKEVSENIEEEFISAKESLGEGYCEQALLEFRRLSAKSRHDERFKIYVYIAKSRLQLKRDDFEQAERELKRALDLDPRHSAVLETQEMIKNEKKRGGFFSRFLK